MVGHIRKAIVIARLQIWLESFRSQAMEKTTLGKTLNGGFPFDNNPCKALVGRLACFETDQAIQVDDSGCLSMGNLYFVFSEVAPCAGVRWSDGWPGALPMVCPSRFNCQNGSQDLGYG